jgi:hypothetical protein
MCGFPPDDNLMSWIAELRARLDDGHLETLPPSDLGHETQAWRAALAIRLMLADLAHFEDMAPDEADDPAIISRRTSLLADFRVLRFLLD